MFSHFTDQKLRKNTLAIKLKMGSVSSPHFRIAFRVILLFDNPEQFITCLVADPDIILTCIQVTQV
jgi:hypothetical protein